MKTTPPKTIVKRKVKGIVNKPQQTSEQKIIQEKKVKFLVYYRQLPVLKLAAASVGRNEDTVQLWRKDDSEFSAQIEDAKAQWAMENAKGVKSKEWLLERLMNNHFGEKKSVDLTSGGKPILGNIDVLKSNTERLDVLQNNSDHQDTHP